MTEPDLQSVAQNFAAQIRTAKDPMVLESIAECIAALDCSDEDFVRLLGLIQENELPEPEPGTSVYRLGGPSQNFQFALGLAKNLRKMRPRF